MSKYSAGEGLSKRCTECGQEIRILVTNSVDHGNEFHLRLKAMCGCKSVSPKATELDGITFSSELPEGWE